jgi:hypothetical protein
MAQLVLHPGEVSSFDEFCVATSSPAAALDGYVSGPARWDGIGHVNFDHHGGCDRLSTRATCEQVALALETGCPVLVDSQGRTRPGLSVHANGADPDVALSWWLCLNPELVRLDSVQRLVALEGVIDTTGGTTIPCPLEELARFAWVIDPWASRREGLAAMDARGLAEVVTDTADRIDSHVRGSQDAGEVDPAYEVMGTVGRVLVVHERHPLARARLVAEGASGFVSVLPGPTPGSKRYSVGVVSPWVQIDLWGVFDELNRLEGCPAEDCWGGCDLVGGSPRRSGSRLAPEAVATVLDRSLRTHPRG